MCPPSSVCPEGSIENIPCDQPFYYVKNEDDLSCTLTYKFYLMVCGSCFAILVLIITSFVTIKKHKNNLNFTPDFYINKVDTSLNKSVWLHFMSHELVGMTKAEMERYYLTGSNDKKLREALEFVIKE